VEKILDDLAVLRAASQFYLLTQPEVLDDLGLTADQRAKMKEWVGRVGRQWAESFRDIGLSPPAERGRRVLAQARANEADLNAILSPPQQARLRQIGLQSEGPGAFRDPEVAAALQLTPEQRERVRVIEDDAAFGWMRGPRPGAPPDARERSVNERLLAVLTDEQSRTWKAMTGEPVKWSFRPVPFGPPAPKRDSKVP